MFSRRSIVESFKFRDFRYHNDINEFALLYGLEDAAGEGGVQAKANNMMEHLIKTNDKTLVTEVITDLLNRSLQGYRRLKEYALEEESFETDYPALNRALKQDGFNVVDYQLIRQLPVSVEVSGNQDELFMLLIKHKLDTPRGHLEQALNSHSIGNWAAANAQLRTYMEGLFDELCDRVFGVDPTISSNAKRVKLGTTNPPLLDPILNEASSDGKNFINGLMKRLHPQGAHAGLSSSEDSTFRLHLVVLTSAYYLRKFDQGISRI
ncbi:hypothetical protein RB298_04945 [Priestia sp. BR_2]